MYIPFRRLYQDRFRNLWLPISSGHQLELSLFAKCPRCNKSGRHDIPRILLGCSNYERVGLVSFYRTVFTQCCDIPDAAALTPKPICPHEKPGSITSSPATITPPGVDSSMQMPIPPPARACSAITCSPTAGIIL